jgi:hypothetical protein
MKIAITNTVAGDYSEQLSERSETFDFVEAESFLLRGMKTPCSGNI